MVTKSNKKTVVFLQDYATKKAGDQISVDGVLARDLVNSGVAKYGSSPEEVSSNDQVPQQDAEKSKSSVKKKR